MNAATTTDTIRELMAKWDEYRAEWIAANGTDEGFAAWFTAQVTGN